MQKHFRGRARVYALAMFTLTRHAAQPPHLASQKMFAKGRRQQQLLATASSESRAPMQLHNPPGPPGDFFPVWRETERHWSEQHPRTFTHRTRHRKPRWTMPMNLTEPCEGAAPHPHCDFLKKEAMPFCFGGLILLVSSVLAGNRDFATSMCMGQWSLAAKVWS